MQIALESRLKPTWDWILTVMDATEAQLRFGVSLTHATDPSHPLHPLHLNPTQPQASTSSSLGGLNVLGGSSQTRTRLIDPNSGSTTRIVGFSSNTENQRNFDRDNYAQSSRREFLTYALSLMRSHSSEHRDSLPVLDVTSLRHIAYVVDSIVYYMRSSKENDDKVDNNCWIDADENENDDAEDEPFTACEADEIDEDGISTTGGRHLFFQRSESTLCLGCPPPDPFSLPLKDALPLADQPHLLQPNANREDLFGIPKQPVTVASGAGSSASPLELPPTRLGLSSAPKPSTSDSTYSSTEATEAQDDQLTSMDTDEKQEAADTEPATQKSTDAAQIATPSTSKEPQPGRRQHENYNIYLQLKKKTYFDFHDEDSKSNADAASGSAEKREEGPQDLSKSTGESSSFVKMELDSDNDTEPDARDPSADASQHLIDDPSAAVRPHIIVSPRKTNVDKSESGRSNESAPDAFGESSGINANSPSKSVIVRAGPSVRRFRWNLC